ncbi:hypothetical protein ILUMI_20699 [Ignelater luminosus]|uniref:PiggyBac transposable element-derived protein domain-containing protein n=1 Tax=Ignelater luminosus TaxID=2038154 RepID=A0A8K0CGY6_IGNLU|nr:hypothetical protein ILUMI_20699 [Ignelater luminosus]
MLDEAQGESDGSRDIARQQSVPNIKELGVEGTTKTSDTLVLSLREKAPAMKAPKEKQAFLVDQKSNRKMIMKSIDLTATKKKGRLIERKMKLETYCNSKKMCEQVPFYKNSDISQESESSEEEALPQCSSTPTLPRKRKIQPFKNLSSVCDRYKVSDTAAATVASAVLQDSPDDTKYWRQIKIKKYCFMCAVQTNHRVTSLAENQNNENETEMDIESTEKLEPKHSPIYIKRHVCTADVLGDENGSDNGHTSDEISNNDTYEASDDADKDFPLEEYISSSHTMSGRQFEQLLRTFNCTNISESTNRLNKVSQLLKMFIKNYQKAHPPGEAISLDEPLPLQKDKHLKMHVKFKESSAAVFEYTANNNTKQVFNDDEEALLKTYLLTAARHHYDLTKTEVRNSAYQFAAANGKTYPNLWNEENAAGPKEIKQIGQMTSGERSQDVTMIAAINAIGNHIPSIWYFQGASSHKKDSMDGVDGTLKRNADRLVLQTLDVLSGTSFVCNLSKKNKVKLWWPVPTSEIEFLKKEVSKKLTAVPDIMSLHQIA